MAAIGTKLVFENDRIRVWEFTLDVGEAIGAHRHDLPYFFYPIEGGTLEVKRDSGVMRATLEAGKVYYRDRGDTHAAVNVGEGRYHEILVELKD